jgi:hypothetical protein
MLAWSATLATEFLFGRFEIKYRYSSLVHVYVLAFPKAVDSLSNSWVSCTGFLIVEVEFVDVVFPHLTSHCQGLQ